MIATNVRRLGLYMMLAFAIVSGSIAYWQVFEAESLSARTDNPEIIAARRSLPRGTIFDAGGQVLASSEVIDGLSRRTYTDPVEVTELACTLDTGRTHQIRVHLRSIGHPVVGDLRYDGARQSLAMSRPFLHAERLGLSHPVTAEQLSFESALPPDLVEVLGRLS